MQLEFRDRQGAAAELASSLHSWHYLNFEIIESTDNGGELFRCTPELGIHRAVVDQSGAVVLTENQLSAALKNTLDEESIREAIATLVGNSWESELDRFRSVDLQEIAHLRAI
jgi:predicted lysophospholipase L1 biosynthesis ABC-type transport system permease subunit